MVTYFSKMSMCKNFELCLSASIFFSLLIPITTLANEADIVVNALEWESIGPDRGGRVTTIAGIESQPFTFYAGTVGGGVLKTENAGQSWQLISNSVFRSASVGAVAVSQSNPQIIFAGMGESTARPYMSSTGDGLYKSEDGGKNWRYLGFKDSRRICSIEIDKYNDNVIYLSVMGDPWRPSQNRGVFKSVDGGVTWDKILYINETTSARNLVISPDNSQIIYVSLWDNIRSPAYLRSGGEGSGIMKSEDGGMTWRRIEAGLPSRMGNVGITLSPSHPSRIFAIIESTEEKGGLYTSFDAGEHWKFVNNSRQLWTRPWYFTHVTAHPTNPDTLFVSNFSLWKSTDGGKSFIKIPTNHADNHALWINPTKPEIIAQGNDGGASVSLDSGKTWSSLFNQRTGQFYRVSTDNDFPYNILASQQDWGAFAIRAHPELGGEAGAVIFPVGGGEAGFVFADPFDTDIYYAGSELGFLSRFDRSKGTATIISPSGLFPEGIDPSKLRYRFDVNAPIIVSPTDEGTLYIGAQVVLKSTNRGDSWKTISPDLTTNRLDDQLAGGGPFTNERIDAHNTIRSLAVSPLDKAIIWAGTDDGLIQFTKNEGKSWLDVSPPNIENGEVYTIVASHHEKGSAYAAVDMHKVRDFKPHIIKTDNNGRTWRSISEGLPQEAFARAIYEDPKRPGLIFAGTEQGVFISFDNGGAWFRLGKNLPSTPVTAITSKENDLIIATEGAGIWLLSGLSTLRSVDNNSDQGTRLFPISSSYQIEGYVEPDVKFEYPNNVVEMDIDLIIEASDVYKKMRIEVLDKDKEVIRVLLDAEKGLEKPLGPPQIDAYNHIIPPELNKEFKAGFHRIKWDMRHEMIVGIVEARDGRLLGAKCPTGSYYLRFQVGDVIYERPLELIPFPNTRRWNVRVQMRKEKLLRDIEALFYEVSKEVRESAEYRRHLEELTPSAANTDLQIKMRQWEDQIVSRNLEAGSLDRINFGGGLIYDINILHLYVGESKLPVAEQFEETYEMLRDRWDELLLEKPTTFEPKNLH